MIFTEEQVDAIVAGDQTVVRVPVDDREPQYRRRAPQIGGRGQSRYLDAPFAPKRGDVIAVRSTARGRAVCKVLVTSVRVDVHAAMTFGDVTRSGYRSTNAYQLAWVRRHDRAWIADGERCPGRRGCWWPRDAAGDVDRVASWWPRAAPDDAELLERFRSHWAPRRVWVVTFELHVAERVRLLSKKPSITGAYTGSLALGLVDEPEALTDGELAKINARVRLAEAQFEALDDARRGRAEDDLADRLARALDDAARHGVDVSRQKESLLRRIAAIESKVRNKQSAVA